MNKKITERFNYEFEISKSCLVAISVSARCESRKQLKSNVDEDLRIEIDDQTFREIPPEKNVQLHNIPASWNGSKLKGLKKTIIFLTNLKKGRHNLGLIPRNSAFIEKIEVKELGQNVTHSVFNVSEQAEDGDRRPWYTFVLVDLPLSRIKAGVTTQYRWTDSDDIKVIVNDKTQKHPKAILHKFWYFAGIFFKKVLKKEIKHEHIFKPNLSKGLQYVEFWADETPTLHNVELDFGEDLDFRTKAKVVWSPTNLREESTSKSKILVEGISKNEEVVVIKKAIKGERYKNKTNDELLATNRWHKVEYQGKIGYIYSLALEIVGEDIKSIQKLIIEKSKEFDISPEILLSLAKCESEFFPYTVSFDEEKPEIAFGVMQLSKILLEDLNDKTKQFHSPVDDVFDIGQNIQGGVSYFNYLYNTRYKDDKDRLRKSVAAYNSGPSSVGVDELLDLYLYDPETQRIVSCVQGHIRKKIFKKILKDAGIIGFALLIFTGSLAFYDVITTFDEEVYFSGVSVAASVIENKSDLVEFPNPNIVWDRDSGNLTFYNTEGKNVAEISWERLNLDEIFNIPSEYSSRTSMHIGHVSGNEIFELSKNTFYFLASTFYSCGAQNCTHVFYKFDSKNGHLEIIDNDLFGISTSFYLSPNNKNLAIVRGVYGGVCNSGNYFDVIDLENFDKIEVRELMNHEEYGVNLIKFLEWIDNDKIKIKTEQFTCDDNKGPLKRTLFYNIRTGEISNQKTTSIKNN